jgi:type IV secretion system protein VirB4
VGKSPEEFGSGLFCLKFMLKKILEKVIGQTGRGVELELPVSDFLPYACHYGKDTLLTKNGELLQIIKVTGFINETVGGEHQLLRDVIRRSIKEHITDNNIALWIHTVRRKTSLETSGEYENVFCKGLNRSWNVKNQWSQKYINEVYISVLYGGKAEPVTDIVGLFSNLFYTKVRHTHLRHLKKASANLTSIVDNMLTVLDSFGARRLSIVKVNNRYYSQPLQFIAKLLNLAEKPVPVPIHDIGNSLLTHRVAVGFNTLEVSGETGKHFGMVYTLKNYFEMNPAVLDQFLQLDQQFVITQTLDYINHKQALKDYRYFNYVLQVSGDEKTREQSGLKATLDSETGASTDYGESQITITLIADSIKELEAHVAESSEVLAHLGIVATRRDLRLEECYWAQFPGNFAYISRKKPIESNRVGGYASLHNFPAGQLRENHWGSAITTFHTAQGTPYFFNFHVGENGHTSIVGPFGMGKTSLMNFLVAEAQKFNCRLFYFDQGRASKVFIKALGGYYTIIKPKTPSKEYAFNPLQIADSKENRVFLKKWLVYLAEAGLKPISDEQKKHLEKVVDHLYTVSQAQRQLSLIAKAFGAVTPGSLGERMARWYGKGEYAHLFDNERKSLMPFDEQIYSFGMSHVVDEKVTLGPILSYLFHRVEMSLDGSPTMVVLDEAWNLVNNDLFAPGLADWLERLKDKNAMVIFATESVDNVSETKITKVIVDKIATQLFLPNDDAESSSAAYRKTWRLSDEEFSMLKSMTLEKRHFMLKQAGKSVVAALDMHGMKELQVLSGDDETVRIMEESMQSKGEKPQQWLPEFYRKYNG